MEETKRTESTRSNSAIKIDKVDQLERYHELSQDKQWVGGLKEFEILGVAAVAYAQTLAYKLECKRLDAELQRIKAQREFAEHTVDKTFDLKLKELNDRKCDLNNFYTTVNNQLSDLHIERMTVLKMAEIVTKKALEDNIDSETRIQLKDMALDLIKNVQIFGDKANVSLKTLVEALPKVKIQNGLLTND
jgi:hypothetical protein